MQAIYNFEYGLNILTNNYFIENSLNFEIKIKNFN